VLLFVFSFYISEVAPVAANFNIGALQEMFFKFVLFVRESAAKGAVVVSFLALSGKMGPHDFPVALKVAIRALEVQLLHSCFLKFMGLLVIRVEFASTRRTMEFSSDHLSRQGVQKYLLQFLQVTGSSWIAIFWQIKQVILF